MHAAPPLAKSPLISSYSSKKCLTKIYRRLLHKMICKFIFTADGWMMYPFNLPLSAPACCWAPFRLSKHRLSISFPNINQSPKKNYPSQLEKTSRYPKENELEVFLNTYPCTNLAYNVISVYLII